ncbi:DUF3592 domain-containing protein [Thorsellia kenyensis]|uniref:DUF3592 domain-containing protein n=1 Tax=Thorsellia kenyensis TaxID=1549888 RepID=A0ABV6C9Y0_9GAMM
MIKTNKLLRYIFLILGIALLIGLIFSVLHVSNQINTYNKTSGVVVSLKEETSNNHSSSQKNSLVYFPVVKYKDNQDKEHLLIESTGSNPPAFYVGEYVEVLYDPLSPDKAEINTFLTLWFGTIILAVFTVVSLIIGIVLFILLKTKDLKKYKQDGIAVIATVFEIKRMDNLKVNGKNPYRIYAKWEDKINFKTYNFVSDNLFIDPSDKIKNNQVTVYYLKNNPKKYAMDLSHITQ